MSFSSDVKEELAGHIARAKHCKIAELSAIISMCATVLMGYDGSYAIKLVTDNLAIAKKFQLYVEDIADVKAQVLVRRGVFQDIKSGSYTIILDNGKAARKLLLLTGIIENNLPPQHDLNLRNTKALKSICCKRAFLRGVFLASGSISDPERFYHFEIVCMTMEKAELIQSVLLSFELDARIVQRKKYYVVYIKEGEQIVDLLNVMEAHLSLLNLESLRVIKEVRNSINRKVNCETANLNRTVNAAVKQIEDINYIKDTVGFEYLNEALRDVAVLRLENTETSLKELGEMLSPPVGKSGVNHRLRKISEIADKLRKNKI